MASAVGLSSETGVDGTFTISHAPLGTYQLKVYRIGFKPLTVSRVSVRVGEDARVAIRLELGAIQLSGIVVAASRRIEMSLPEP
jgi:carboxypeptidase family protein